MKHPFFHLLASQRRFYLFTIVTFTIVIVFVFFFFFLLHSSSGRVYQARCGMLGVVCSKLTAWLDQLGKWGLEVSAHWLFHSSAERKLSWVFDIYIFWNVTPSQGAFELNFITDGASKCNRSKTNCVLVRLLLVTEYLFKAISSLCKVVPYFDDLNIFKTDIVTKNQ